MIRTIAASISCLRSSSTLLRVSFRSGSDSPLAATVWILTLEITLQILASFQTVNDNNVQISDAVFLTLPMEF
jgi:hypothetical protein